MNKTTSLVTVMGAVICIGVLSLTPAAYAQAINSDYEAASGLFPTEVCPPWTLADNASPEDPALSAGNLVIETSGNSENINYNQTGVDISIPESFVIEARVRLVSGSSSNYARGPSGITFQTGPYLGNLLMIGTDEIFLLADDLVRGQTAVVDTDDAFHTYRIEVDQTGAVDVFYDNVLTLSGSIYSHPNHAGFALVRFGDVSSLAHGTSEWSFVRHNASATDSANGAGGCDKDNDGVLAFEDCDDLDASTFPGATELCGGKDNDCDTAIPANEFDDDIDGFRGCENDCDDGDSAINPDSAELPGNTIDENCDGSLGECDPTAVWRNHGHFVRCVAHEVNDLVAGGLITEEEGDELIKSSAQSDVGKNN